MSELPENLRGVDWSVTTFEGARREQLRRWAALPLDQIIAGLEEMADLAAAWGPASPTAPTPRLTASDHNQPGSER
ncbi:MAG: hypothetical protein HY560_03545 [Gemmatimonadetes bacterium]|nr:hypothetical protein [Gemmatimonadota bacterium]